MDKKEWKFIPIVQNPKLFPNAALKYKGRTVACDRCNRENLSSCIACDQTEGVDLCSLCFATLFEAAGWCARSGVDVYGRKLGDSGLFSLPPSAILETDVVLQEDEKKGKEKNGKGGRGIARGGKMSQKDQEKYVKDRKDK